MSGGAIFDPDETSGLRRLFGKGPQGARHLLDAISQGPIDLPTGVTSDVLDRYARLARDMISAGQDKTGVQTLRLRAIKILMES